MFRASDWKRKNILMTPKGEGGNGIFRVLEQERKKTRILSQPSVFQGVE